MSGHVYVKGKIEITDKRHEIKRISDRRSYLGAAFGLSFSCSGK